MPKCLLSRSWFLLLVVLLCVGLGSGAVLLNAGPAQSAQEPKEQQPPPPEPDQPDASDAQQPDPSDQVIHDVLEPLRSGMEGHTLPQVLAVFDPVEMQGYAQVCDQLTVLFRLYDPIRFGYKVLQVTSDKGRGFAIAEIDMAATPADQDQMPVPRSTQMRFQLKLGPKGWKVVKFTPGDFFAQP
jgi:hypothetical protein